MSKTLALIAALAIVSSTFMSIPVYAEDELSAEDIFNEEIFADELAAEDKVADEEAEKIFADDMAVDEIDDTEMFIDEIETNDKAASVTDSYSTAQKAAYDAITAACDEFLNSDKTIYTNYFKVIILDTALSKNDIDTIVKDIKESGSYPVLNSVGLNSTTGDKEVFDKIALATKPEYRTAEGRKAAKPVQKPTITSAEAGDGKVTIEWNAVNGAANYRVWKVINGSYIRVGDFTGTTATITGLTNGTECGFIVRANVNGTFTSYSENDIVYATPKASVHVNITSATAGDKKVTIKWDTVEGATSYRIWKYEGSTCTRVGDTQNTTIDVTGLTNGTEYGFIVRANVNGVYTSYSTDDIVYVTPKASAHVNITSATAGDKKVTIKWDAIDGATSYRIWRYTGNVCARIGDTTNTSMDITGLTNGTEYGFLVRANVNGTFTPYSTDDIVYVTPNN